MKIADLSTIKPKLHVQLKPVNLAGFGQELPNDADAILESSSVSSHTGVLTIEEKQWEVCGRDDLSQHYLEKVLQSESPRICCVDYASGADKHNPITVNIKVYEFKEQIDLPSAQISVDERIRTDVARITGKTAKVEKKIKGKSKQKEINNTQIKKQERKRKQLQETNKTDFSFESGHAVERKCTSCKASFQISPASSSSECQDCLQHSIEKNEADLAKFYDSDKAHQKSLRELEIEKDKIILEFPLGEALQWIKERSIIAGQGKHFCSLSLQSPSQGLVTI